MEFKLKINMDNEVFDINPEWEVARILGRIANKLKSGTEAGKAFDINGNSVGTFEIIGD